MFEVSLLDVFDELTTPDEIECFFRYEDSVVEVVLDVLFGNDAVPFRLHAPVDGKNPTTLVEEEA